MSTQAQTQPSGSDYVRICIKSQDGNKEYYRVKSSTQIRTLLLKYCEEKGVEYQSTNFVFEGRRLVANRKTISQAGLEDQSEVEALVHQNGG